MYQKLSKKSSSWIVSNLKIFVNVAKLSFKLNPLWKPFSELLFISIFKKNNKELTKLLNNELKDIEKKEVIFNNISRKDFGKIVLMIFFEKKLDFTEDMLNSVKIFPYRDQLEFYTYFSLLNHSDSLMLINDKILENTLIYQRLSVENFETMDIYELTHEVMYFTMLGRSKHQILLNNLEYLEKTISYLLKKMLTEQHIDLIAELILISQLLDIDIESKVQTDVFSVLSTFVEENINKKGVYKMLINKEFYKIYHQMLVISLLQ